MFAMMDKRTRACLFSLEVGVRLIGIVTTIIYSFVFVFLCSGVKDVMSNVKIRIILGVDWWHYFRPKEREVTDWDLILGVVFSACCITSSTILICSTIKKQRIFTAPWLLCCTLYIVLQVCSFGLFFKHHASSCEIWVTVLSVLYTVLIICFWMVVIVAQYSWRSPRKKKAPEKNHSIWNDIFQAPVPSAHSPYINII